MSAKAIIILCAQALFIQSAFSQCVSRGNYGAGLSGYGCGASALAAPTAIAGNGLSYGAGLGYGSGFGYGAGVGDGAGQGYGIGQGYGGLAIGAIPTSGGALPVSSTSAIAPTGLSVESENVYEGALSVTGELPFLSAVALEGVFPSAGAGVVNYSCGNGVTAIESISSSGDYAPAGVPYAPAAVAYGAGIGAITPVSAIGAGISYGRGCGCGLY